VVGISTWNIHGSARPDLDAVVQRIRAMDADVVALQEVQRRQATAIARALGWPTAHWSFKHFPIVKPPEGHAVLSPHPLTWARTVVLSRWVPPWSHRRRIAQLVRVRLAERDLSLANAHLASTSADDRLAQTRRLLAALPPGTVVAGDLNARPGSDVHRLFATAGLEDAWGTLHPDANEPDGATHWRPRDPDDAPTRRIDYILVPAQDQILAATVPTAADSDMAAYRHLSDHLPVTARLAAVPNARRR
jgi:endonuclease/exonuclease/phosphatase family metal-dependent hydrolase